MRGALVALGERDRMILGLLYEQGMTQDEIAERLGVDKSTVSRRLVAARARVLEEVWARVPAGLGLARGELAGMFALVGGEMDLGFAAVVS
jgi:FixJ family two-component response regulator